MIAGETRTTLERAWTTRWRRALRLGVCATILAVSACVVPEDGLDAPLEQLHFPVGLALGPGGDFLLVANSDFDINYKSGTVQSYGLEALRSLLPSPCNSDDDCQEAGRRCDVKESSNNDGIPSFVCVESGGAGEGKPCGDLGSKIFSERLKVPGRCNPIALTSSSGGTDLLVDAVRISALATDAKYRANPNNAGVGRLFLPVRGDTTLHWIDVDERGELQCGQDSRSSRCDSTHRAGDRGDFEVPSNPFEFDVSEDGRQVVVTHQAEGKVSLFVNEWSDSQSGDGPRLHHVVSGLPSNPAGIVALPGTRTFDSDEPDFGQKFLVSYRNSPQIDVLSVVDAAPTFDGLALARTARAQLRTSASAIDSRGIAVDPTNRNAARAACLAACDDNAADAAGADCPGNSASCISDALEVPVDIYVAGRSPANLLVGRTQAADVGPQNVAKFSDTIDLPAGASRVVLGRVRVGSEEDALEQRVFALSFDGRTITVYDPERGIKELEIKTGRGPHALLVDEKHGLGYVAHFINSYIGVISLDKRFPRTYGSFLGTIGAPTEPRAAK